MILILSPVYVFEQFWKIIQSYIAFLGNTHEIGDVNATGAVLLAHEADAEALARLLQQLDLDLVVQLARFHVLALPVEDENRLKKEKKAQN